MKKQTKNKIIGGLLGSVISGIYFFGYFTGYGGNRCDISYVGDPNMGNLTQLGSCDCFCCQGIYGQGYESCGMFGLSFGIIVGAILGVLIVRLIQRK